MPATPGSIALDKYTIGALLLALLLFSWLSSIKNTVSEWVSTSEAADAAAMPNILMIVVDDLGYDDTSAINPDGLNTPNIQQLAEGGVTFRRHYADATCTPSRVAMLTGRDAERSGFRPVGTEIPAEYPTIAEQLRELGYATHLTGKWHAGEEREEGWPQNKGFDGWFGFLNQWELSGEITLATIGIKKPTYHNPFLRTDGGALQQYSGHLTEILTEHTIDKIRSLEKSPQPWFVYHAFLAPHQPIQPAEDYAAKFPNTPEGRYTALVTQLDAAVGRILQAVDTANTLVVFVSDNGGTNAERNNNFPFHGRKGEIYEGSYRTPLIMHWPKMLPQGQSIDDIVMNVDIYPTLLSAANKPLPADIDGRSLWPLMLQGNAPQPGYRSWEVYSENINALGFSLIDATGQWRIASQQGFPPELYDLANNPAGDTNVAPENQAFVEQLLRSYWREHWVKSTVPAIRLADTNTGQTRYSGFNTLRSPYRHGFAIGLEIGPLPADIASQDGDVLTDLAGQEGIWELGYSPQAGLLWRIGDDTLKATQFDPTKCNPVVLTGYFQPKGHLAKRDPRSQIRLYLSGRLADSNLELELDTLGDSPLHNPTYVNYNGKAHFANMMLSSYDDEFVPRLKPEYQDMYRSLHKQRQLLLADVAKMSETLCQAATPEG